MDRTRHGSPFAYDGTFIDVFLLRLFPALSVKAASRLEHIGGTASASIVADIYQPSLAPIGLLLAIFMNIIGTSIGLGVAQACHWIAR